MLPIIRISRAGRKIGSFGYARVSACGQGKAKCANCGLAEFQFYLCGREKNKTRSGRLSCRQKVCPLVGICYCIFDV